MYILWVMLLLCPFPWQNVCTVLSYMTCCQVVPSHLGLPSNRSSCPSYTHCCPRETMLLQWHTWWQRRGPVWWPLLRHHSWRSGSSFFRCATYTWVVHTYVHTYVHFSLLEQFVVYVQYVHTHVCVFVCVSVCAYDSLHCAGTECDDQQTRVKLWSSVRLLAPRTCSRSVDTQTTTHRSVHTRIYWHTHSQIELRNTL